MTDRLRGEKRIENPRQILRGDAWTIVGDNYSDLVVEDLSRDTQLVRLLRWKS